MNTCFTGDMQLRLSKAHATPSLHALLLVLGLAPLGCNGDPDNDEPDPVPAAPRTCLDPDTKPSSVPDFPLAYETEHLDIYLDEGQFLCAGSALDYERFVSYVGEQTGVDVQRRIPVYFAEWVSEWCSVGAAACTHPDGVVFARPYSSYHELGHAVVCEKRVNTPALLAEGLAVSFQPTQYVSHGNPTEFSEFQGTDFFPYYAKAGYFVRWLHEQLGPEAFMDLYTTASYETGVWSAIEAAYGTHAEADYHATAPALWVPHRQCADLPILEPNGEMWLFEATLDCDDPSTMGPYERVEHEVAHFERRAMYQSFLIDIETPGTYRFERPDFLVEGFTDVRVQRCLDEHPATEQEIDEEWVDDSVWFTLTEHIGMFEFEHAGLWRLDVLHEHGPPKDVWVTIERMPG
jgi:hypothetical protein